jgi:hypothetical protein
MISRFRNLIPYSALHKAKAIPNSQGRMFDIHDFNNMNYNRKAIGN